MRIQVQAPAKINLTLDVVGRREDGYHLLESIMQTVSCYDTLLLEKAETVSLTTVGGEPCPVEKNTAYKAAKAFFAATGIRGGVAIQLTKAIPQQAGMGGGSADAAGVLWGLDRLYDTGLSVDRLREIGLTVGADVPFCVQGGTAYVTGIGEGITPLQTLPECSIVIAQPPEGVSTGAAYAAIDGAATLRRPCHRRALEALSRSQLAAVAAEAENVFEAATAIPGVAAIRQAMEGFGPLCSRMTGSGSAVFALFEEEARATACAEALQKRWPVAFVCHPCSGVRLTDLPDND